MGETYNKVWGFGGTYYRVDENLQKKGGTHYNNPKSCVMVWDTHIWDFIFKYFPYSLNLQHLFLISKFKFLNFEIIILIETHWLLWWMNIEGYDWVEDHFGITHGRVIHRYKWTNG